MRALLPIAIISLVVGLSVGGAIGMSVVPSDGSAAIEAPGTGSSQESTDPLPVANSYQELYDRTIDSVVKIRVQSARGTSQGSGFVYDSTYIVTNQHVVGNENSVLVQFSNGEWKTGRVVGADDYTDLAVIAVGSMPEGASPLPVATRNPEPGQPVAAIGTPFGLEGTITHGIVSGVNRSMRVEGGFSIPDTVQTDAPINPGNSGGPLVSMQGEVVGVNRAKEGDNIGFAISAAVVNRVVPAIIEDGSYDHSYVGIQTLPVTPAIAEANGLERAQGLAVVETVDDTPAADVLEGGELDTTGEVPIVTDGDIIVAIDDRPVHSNQDLSRYLLLHTQPGDTVDITVIRDGERISVELELIERPPT